MATRKDSSKTSRRASGGLKVELDKKDVKKLGKSAKKVGIKGVFIALAFLIVGAAVGAGGWWIVCRNDCFDIVGSSEVFITTAEKYVDEGVKVIAFGKDVSDDVTIETNLSKDENGEYFGEVGRYYIKYISTNFKYNTLFKVEKVRIVNIVEESEGGD